MSQRKRQKLGVDGAAITTTIETAEPQGVALQVLETTPALQGPRQQRSLFVRSLPPTATTETLTEHFSQSYPLKHALVVVDPVTRKSKGYGFITFADAEDAERAKVEFDESLFEGQKIKLEVAEPRKRETAKSGLGGHAKRKPEAATIVTKIDQGRPRKEGLKSPKLIIRNLPWTIKHPDQLAALFRSYGKVKHATIPSRKPGLLAGFGFVVLRGRKNAEKALEGVNGKEVDGRTLAVDWAVEKEVWETLHHSDNGIGMDGLENDDTAGQEDNSSTVKSEEGGMIDLGHLPVGEDHSVSVSDESEGEEQDKWDQQIERQGMQDNSLTLFIRNLPFTSTDEVLKEHFSPFGAIRYARVVLDHGTGKAKGTGFVCFYDRDATDTCLRGAPKLEPASTQPKGAPRRNAAVPGTKHSLLEDPYADRSGRYTLDGRVLQITRAVDRNEAVRLTTEGSSLRETRDKDKRRLYLLSEGTVPSNSPVYETLSPSEIKLREDSAKQRQALIKSNPTLHISLTRLSIRNIPRNITSKELKALAREAVVGFAKDVKQGTRRQLSKEEMSRGGDQMKDAEKARKAKGKGIVKQAKIVFEGREGGKVAEDSGAGRSRGYGFVEYISHRWALMGLRWLNGHAVGQLSKAADASPSSRQQSQDKKKRLVVEFAIENAQVVGRRLDREIKARERSQLVVEKRKTGEVIETTERTLPRDTLMARSRKELKRKHDAPLLNQELPTFPARPSVPRIAVSKSLESLAKRQQIIARKRTMRRTRKTASV
ncbi:RNA recognition motif-containing protein [Schaereria dolodes]|nr:RNA recognition motif-containing protein [Schaereria dolodes]